MDNPKVLLEARSARNPRHYRWTRTSLEPERLMQAMIRLFGRVAATFSLYEGIILTAKVVCCECGEALVEPVSIPWTVCPEIVPTADRFRKAIFQQVSSAGGSTLKVLICPKKRRLIEAPFALRRYILYTGIG